jgi:hypothetical protein
VKERDDGRGGPSKRAAGVWNTFRLPYKPPTADIAVADGAVGQNVYIRPSPSGSEGSEATGMATLHPVAVSSS